MDKYDTAMLISERLGLKTPMTLILKRKSKRIKQDLENFKLSPKLKPQMDSLASYFSNFDQTTLRLPNRSPSFSVSLDRKSAYNISGSKLFSMNLESRELNFEIDLKKGHITCFALCPDNGSIVLGLNSGYLVYFDILTKANKLEKWAYRDSVKFLAVSSGSYLVSCGEDGNVILWDLTKDKIEEVFRYSTSNEVLAVDIDNKYIVTGGTGKSVSIFNIQETLKIKEITELDFSDITSLKISAKGQFLAFGDSDGKVFLYNFTTWQRIWDYSGHFGKVSCIEIDYSERYVISGGYDAKILFWSTDFKKIEPVEAFGHTGPINEIKQAAGLNMIYSLSSDKTIKTWGLPRMNHCYIILYIIPLCISIEEFPTLHLNENDRRYFYFMNSNFLIKLDNLGIEIGRLSLKDLKNIHIAHDQVFNRFCVAGCESFHEKKKSLYIFNIYSGYDFSVLKEINRKCQGIYSMIYSNSGSYLIIGEFNNFVILHAENLSVYYEYSRSTSPIVYVSQSPLLGFLTFVTDSSSTIKLFSLAKTEVVNVYEDETFVNIIKTVFSLDEEFIIVLPKQQDISVWSVSKYFKIHTKENDGILDMEFHKNKNFLYFLRNSSFECLSFPSFSSNYTINLQENIRKFVFSSDLKEIIFLTDSKLEVWLNPGETEKLSVFGNKKDIYRYSEYIAEIISNKSVEYKEEFSSWIIEPFHINVLHLFCYFNKITNLELSFDKKPNFFESKTGNTPLDMALDIDLEKGISIIKRYFTKAILSYPLVTSLLQSSFFRLIQHSSPMSKDILELILIKTLDNEHPLYSRYKLPLIIFSDSIFINKPQTESYFLTEESSVDYLQTYFKLNLCIGSPESITFLKFLYFTKNENTYNTKFIQTILKYKWKKVKLVLFVQGAFYLTYLLFLSLFSARDEPWQIFIAFLLNFGLILFQLIQFYSSKIDYLINPWNYIDFIRSGLMIWLLVRVIANYSKNHDVVASVIFVSWVRGLSYFRLFRDTRYFIRLIGRIIIDIFPFLFIFLYCCVAFSLIFHRLNHMEYKYSQYLAWSWEINLGSFDTTFYDEYLYFSFAIYSLFNPIILLTLLVSIMSSTYEKVSSSIVIAEGHQLCEMVLEAELIMFWKRHQNQQHYLHVCRLAKSIHVNEEDSQIHKTKAVKKCLKNMSMFISKNSEKMQDLNRGQVSCKKEVSELSRRLEKIEEKFNDSQRKNKKKLGEIKELIINLSNQLSAK